MCYCSPHLRIDREAGIERGSRPGKESLRKFELEGQDAGPRGGREGKQLKGQWGGDLEDNNDGFSIG